METNLKALKEQVNKLKAEKKQILMDSIEKRGLTSEDMEKRASIDTLINELEKEIEAEELRRATVAEKAPAVEHKVVLTQDEARELEVRRAYKGLVDNMYGVDSAEAREFRAQPNDPMLRDPNGKNIIPTNLVQEILTALEYHSEIFAQVRKFPAQAGELALPARFVNGKAGFVGENESIKAISQSYEIIKLSQKRCGAYTKVTRQFLLDAEFDMIREIIDVLAEEMAEGIEYAIFCGNVASADAGKSFDGIYNHIADTAGALTKEQILGTGAQAKRLIRKVETAASNTLTTDDLMNTVTTLHTKYQPTARWTMTHEFYQACCLIKDALGHHIVQSENINGKPATTLFGFPIVITNSMVPASESDDSKKLLAYFGDLGKAYAMMVKKDIAMYRVDNDTDSILKATELLAIDCHMDGTVYNPEAVVALCNKAE